MNLNAQMSSPNADLKMTLMLEPLASGGVAASVLEVPTCRVESATREEAIAQIRLQLVTLLNTAELLPLKISRSEIERSVSQTESPWVKFAGMFENDPDFAIIAAAIRAEREVDDDTEVDPAVYALES
jgi:hypothetical protein